jgi:hypothetical protein
VIIEDVACFVFLSVADFESTADEDDATSVPTFFVSPFAPAFVAGAAFVAGRALPIYFY